MCNYTCVFVCWVKPAPAHHAVAACSIQGRKTWKRREIFRLELLRWSARGWWGFKIFAFFFFLVATHPSCTRRWGATYCQQEASWHLPCHFPPLHKHPIITLCLILLLLKVSKPFYSKSAFSTFTIAFFFFLFIAFVQHGGKKLRATHRKGFIHVLPPFVIPPPLYSAFRQHKKQLNQHHFLSAAMLLCLPPQKIKSPPLPPGYPAVHSGIIYHVAPGCSAHFSRLMNQSF